MKVDIYIITSDEIALWFRGSDALNKRYLIACVHRQHGK